ncbi:MAG: isochorismate synthase [Cyanobacteria bacterium J06627_8]
MAIFQKFQEVLHFVWDGAARIFAPSGDTYPATGVQPYEGDPYEESDEWTRL